MSSVLEWAESLEKSKKGKPSEQLQKELFDRIKVALAENENPVRDCVQALCKFDSKVIDPFYNNYYWNFKEDLRKAWDRSMISWAKGTKTSGTALIRIIQIMCNKVSHSGDTTIAEEELKWLALCEDSKLNERIATLAKKGNRDLLLKLLTLDMNSWNIGKIGMEKIYSILFSENKDPEIIRLYQEFRVRNHIEDEASKETAATAAESADGKSLEPATEENNMTEADNSDLSDAVVNNPETSEISQGDNDTEEQKKPEEQNRAATDEQKPGQGKPEEQNRAATEEQSPGQGKASNFGGKSRNQGINPMDGEALAASLQSWVHRNKVQVMSLQTEVLDQKKIIKKLTEEKESLAEEREALLKNEDALQNQVFTLKKEKASLEEQLQAAHFSAATLQEEKEDTEDKLRQVLAMGNNSVKQEVGGLRTSLAADLKHTIQDFRSDISDMTDAEKCEIYKTLMEEVIDTLNHHHIVVEEN